MDTTDNIIICLPIEGLFRIIRFTLSKVYSWTWYSMCHGKLEVIIITTTHWFVTRALKRSIITLIRRFNNNSNVIQRLWEMSVPLTGYYWKHTQSQFGIYHLRNTSIIQHLNVRLLLHHIQHVFRNCYFFYCFQIVHTSGKILHQTSKQPIKWREKNGPTRLFLLSALF